MHTTIAILSIEHSAERHILRALLLVLALLACGYLYFVAASVLNVIASREASAQASRIETSIGSLEERYFTLAQSITPQEGESLGYVHIANESFIYRAGGTALVNTREAAI